MMPVHRVIWGTAVPDLIHRLIDKITFNDTIRKSCNIFYFSLSFFSLLFVLVASVCVCVCNFRRARSRYSLWQNDGGVNFWSNFERCISMYLGEKRSYEGFIRWSMQFSLSLKMISITSNFSIFLPYCWGKILSIGYTRSGKNAENRETCILLSRNVSFLETSGVCVGNLNIDEERDFFVYVHVLQVGMIIYRFRFVIEGTFLRYK